MLSRDLRALAAWFGPVAAGDQEMTHEGARLFLKGLERAAEDAEALEEAATPAAEALRQARVVRGPLPANVVAFRARRPAQAGGSSGGDAA